ncbi:MAG: response regulator [Henriciella sp.]|uniref:response regulator n=1 Tax=Henriciella sp. TaxID=1968823 RepID=UPI003C79086C
MTQLHSKNVLIVEDEPFIALDLKFSVEAHGGTVVGVANGLDDAMKMAKALEIDVALLDYNLDPYDSLPVAEALRARSIPFIFYTGRGDLSGLKAKWPDVSVLAKPAQTKLILKSLADAA